MKTHWSSLAVPLLFAFSAPTWPLWEAFCAQQPFLPSALYPRELLALHDAGVWGEPGEPLPSAADATQACENYANYRQSIK